MRRGDRHACVAFATIVDRWPDLPPSVDHNRGKIRLTHAAAVSDIVTVIVVHRLGKAEATNRLKTGLARATGHLGPMIAIEQETWDGDTLSFVMRALGHTADARIQVLEDALRIEVSLPWLLAKAAKRLLPILQKEATALLEKK